MKYREFIESSNYAKNLHYWIDMTFGKRQQSKEDKNIFFNTATQEYYDNADEKTIDRVTVFAAFEFYQLPKQLFANFHRALGSKDQTEEISEEEKKGTQRITESVKEVNKEDIQILKDEVINNLETDQKEFENKRLGFEILTGSIKNHDHYLYLVTKMYGYSPMLSVQKFKKERVQPSQIQELTFEILFPRDYCFATNYITSFTVFNKDFVVISRLYTGQFGVINLDQEAMQCKYFGVD